LRIKIYAILRKQSKERFLAKGRNNSGRRGPPSGGGGNNGGYNDGGGYDNGGGNYNSPPPRRRAPQKRKPQRRPGRGFFGTLAYWGAVASLWIAVLGVGIFIWVASDLPDPEELWRKTDRPSITYVDIHGQVIERRGAADAPPVDLKSMPKYVPQAVMAIEDRKFYQHFGFDPFGFGRAMLSNLRSGRVVAGGSTLTQQLAKNLFLSSDQNIKRKAQELLLAFWLESRFTKDEILSLYLARVYFGAGAYGLDEASERYFNKEPSQLTISEAALLAGLLKAPSKYNPVSSTKRAAERATVVLNVMEEQGVITHEQRLQAVKEPLKFVEKTRGSNIGYFLDWIEPLVGAQIGEPTEDIIVETTLDVAHQTYAETAIDREFNANFKSLNMGQAALIAISGDGGVRALVGGRSYNESEFNRVIDAKRQPGSAFKPFVYLAALERGESPYSTRIDRPIKVGDWSPQNYDNSYRGSMPLISAFAQSVNTIAVQLGEEAGRDTVVRVARRLGIRSRLDPQPTLALGTEVLSPIELTSAFVPFSNGGAGITPYGFKRIRTKSGKILWERPTPAPRRVVDDGNLRNMNLMFKQVVDAGTARSAIIPGYMVGGKTGTTSDYRDAWFVGFTGGYTTGVWVGNDDFKTRMNKVTGGSAPARIWRDFMANALKGTPPRALPLPVGAPTNEAAFPLSPTQSDAQPIDSPAIIGDPTNNVGIATDESATRTDANAASPKPDGQTIEQQQEVKSIDQIVKEVQEKNK
jgi:penicillin-binding protein 1A